MPIYEYKCGECGRKVSLFFTSFSVAESRAEAGENRCPRCGSPELKRVMSRARAVRVGSRGGEYDGEMGSDLGEDSMGAMGDDLMEGINQDDPREVARWARQMKESLGEDVDMGPEFDQALTRIEKGEDPEKVMGDYGPEAFTSGEEDSDE
jgi:putative FmdB family regulatory protein